MQQKILVDALTKENKLWKRIEKSNSPSYFTQYNSTGCRFTNVSINQPINGILSSKTRRIRHHAMHSRFHWHSTITIAIKRRKTLFQTEWLIYNIRNTNAMALAIASISVDKDISSERSEFLSLLLSFRSSTASNSLNKDLEISVE